MRISQRVWAEASGWQLTGDDIPDAHLVLLFAASSALRRTELYDEIVRAYPDAHIVGCSTAGEIVGRAVLDDSMCATAIRFDKTTIQIATVDIASEENSLEAGRNLARSLAADGLAHVIVLSDGLKVNGTDLTNGLRDALPAGVAVTGGLSGDGAAFQHTFVCADAPPREGLIAAIGLYGADLRVGYGSLGGWDSFGPERLITRSEGNVLYELDGQSALALYERYLGEHAEGLPATGLLFPLSLRSADDDRTPVVRTILAVDRDAQSMTFAGDVPEGSYARLMKANFERLIDGAHQAAQVSYDALGQHSPELALLISCVGRKLVLKQRIEEEIEAVSEVVGDETVISGFYSYGEICPAAPNASCELHNQTMTITTLREV